MYFLELGGEDDAFAAREAASTCDAVERLAPGLATARAVRRVADLAFTRTASELLGRTDASVESARALLAAAGIDREGSVRVRARDVRSATGVSTSRAERELGSALVERGFTVDLEDPDHELRALFSDDVCAVGWRVAESTRDFGSRDPGERPFFQPGSMSPMLARALANVAGAGPDARILDPMCGTGGTLIEAGLVGSRVVGSDVQWKMARGARENLAWAGVEGSVVRGNARRLPFPDGAFDGVVFDAPYGRQSKIVGDLRAVVTDALSEARRVAPRCVLVADRDWTDAAATAGWHVDAAFERRVHRSLTRHVLVLAPEERRAPTTDRPDELW